MALDWISYYVKLRGNLVAATGTCGTSPSGAPLPRLNYAGAAVVAGKVIALARAALVEKGLDAMLVGSAPVTRLGASPSDRIGAWIGATADGKRSAMREDAGGLEIWIAMAGTVPRPLDMVPVFALDLGEGLDKVYDALASFIVPVPRAGDHVWDLNTATLYFSGLYQICQATGTAGGSLAAIAEASFGAAIIEQTRDVVVAAKDATKAVAEAGGAAAAAVANAAADAAAAAAQAAGEIGGKFAGGFLGGLELDTLIVLGAVGFVASKYYGII